MSIGSLFTPSIRRTLLSRTMLIAIVPIILIGTLAIWLSQDLLQARFNDEAQIVAAAIANGIADRITLAQRGSAVLSALPEARDLTIARDANGLRELLIPLKSRLALDLAFVCDPTGTIIAGAQDFKAGDTLPPELVARVRAHAEASYVIYSEPRGLLSAPTHPFPAARRKAPRGTAGPGYLLDTP